MSVLGIGRRERLRKCPAREAVARLSILVLALYMPSSDSW